MSLIIELRLLPRGLYCFRVGKGLHEASRSPAAGSFFDSDVGTVRWLSLLRKAGVSSYRNFRTLFLEAGVHLVNILCMDRVNLAFGVSRLVALNDRAASPLVAQPCCGAACLVGVASSLPERSSNAFRFDGVFVFTLLASPSNIPSTWPSFCGVGPIQARCLLGVKETDTGASYGSMTAGCEASNIFRRLTGLCSWLKGSSFLGRVCFLLEGVLKFGSWLFESDSRILL